MGKSIGVWEKLKKGKGYSASQKRMEGGGGVKAKKRTTSYQLAPSDWGRNTRGGGGKGEDKIVERR